MVTFFASVIVYLAFGYWVTVAVARGHRDTRISLRQSRTLGAVVIAIAPVLVVSFSALVVLFGVIGFLFYPMGVALASHLAKIELEEFRGEVDDNTEQLVQDFREFAEDPRRGPRRDN